jgi:hypothetical protein
VLDTTDARGLAEFYRALLGFEYRRGDDPPGEDTPENPPPDWLVLHHPDGQPRIAFQLVPTLPRPTWPDDGIPQQLHLDLTVATVDDLNAQHARALRLGARLLLDRSDDEQEPLRVYADPAGHPFCIFVAPS